MCVYAYIYICIYICVCATIIIFLKKEVINLRVGGRTWKRSKGEDLERVEEREGESDIVMF